MAGNIRSPVYPLHLTETACIFIAVLTGDLPSSNMNTMMLYHPGTTQNLDQET